MHYQRFVCFFFFLISCKNLHWGSLIVKKINSNMWFEWGKNNHKELSLRFSDGKNKHSAQGAESPQAGVCIVVVLCVGGECSSEKVKHFLYKFYMLQWIKSTWRSISVPETIIQLLIASFYFFDSSLSIWRKYDLQHFIMFTFFFQSTFCLLGRLL